MAAETHFQLIYTTFPSQEEAFKIGRQLLSERLVACINILGEITSLYVWQNEPQEGKETAVLLKTTKNVGLRLKQRLGELHSYETPAIIEIQVGDVNPDFLAWVQSQTN